MNQETTSLTERINKLLLKSDGKYNTTKTLNSKKDLISEILSVTSFITWDCKLSTRIWYILNDKHEVRRCSICGKEIHERELSLNYPAKPTCGARYCVSKQRVNMLLAQNGPDYFKHWQDKVKETNLVRYGVANAMDAESVSAKQQQKIRDRVSKDKEIILQKRIDTLTTRYGVTNVGQLPDHTAKMQNTSIHKFGAISYSSTQACKDKVSEHWKNITPEKLADIRKKSEATCLRKYGVSSYSKTYAAQRTRRSQYQYNGMFFDSSYELSYFLWALYNNKAIDRPSVTFEYSANGRTHVYIPDFIVDGELVEIKGAHFFNEAGDLVNPFSKEPQEQEVYKQKGICMKENNITVIKDGNRYRKWVDITYGREFCDNCRLRRK